MGLIDALYGVAWAIRPEALAALCEIAERRDIDPERLAAAMHHDPGAQIDAIKAVEQRRGAPMDGSHGVTRRGQVAVVQVVGPIVRYAGLFSASGGTSIEGLARDFTIAMDDPQARAILLHVDSPGGEIAGVAEMADIIHQARSVKPVWAYISDLGASAGYWLGSAAEQVVVAETAAVGSIGAVAAVRDPSHKSNGEIEFVSSVSPHKRADPTTEAGRTQLQALVDQLGEIFVAAVARNRGTDSETVARDFGAGGLLIGSRAVAAGMAERVGSFERTLDDLEAAIDGQDAAAATEPTAVQRPPNERKRGRSMTASLRARFQRFVTSLDPPDAEALADALDGVSPQPQLTVSNGVGVASGSISAIPEPPPPPPPPEEPVMPEISPITVPTTGARTDDDVPSHVANRLAQLEAENARMHAERIQERARAFAEAQVRDFRATAAQVDVIASLFATLAEDDERFKAIVRVDGSRVLRTTLLENFFASQPDRSVLGQEMIAAGGGQAVWDRATAARPDPNAEATPEQLVAYLERTALGRATLTDLKSQAGGR